MNGGGYGHNGGRQQRKRPRDFDDNQYRRPRAFDVLEKLKRDLVNLADPGNVNPIEDIKYVGRRLAIDFEAPENQTRLLELLRDCIGQLPVKASHYAATISLAAIQNSDFGVQALQMLSSSLTEAFSRQAWRDAKLILRVLTAMTPVISNAGDTVLSIIKRLAEQVQSSQLDSIDQFADESCKIIMLTLPYLAAATPGELTSLTTESVEILDRISTYMDVRKNGFADITRQRSQDQSNGEVECLDLLFSQCRRACDVTWTIDYLPQLTKTLGLTEQANKLELPSVNLADRPSTQSPSTFPQYYFNLFSGQAVESVPDLDNLASSVFRDLTTDVLDTLVTNRKDAARFLIDLESYLPSDLFVLRGTPLDKISPDGPTWKAEDVVVEGIFANLLALPTSNQKAVYYHSVLTELCKLVPQAIAPTFGRAIRAIYNDLENLEPEIVYRFWDWFSHHMSNFGFNWKWQEWIPDLDLPPSHPKSVFIAQAIAKEAELSYNQRIKTTLPKEYHGLISDEAPGPNFVSLQADHPLVEETNKLMSVLSTASGTAESDDEVRDALRAIATKAQDAGLDPETESLTVLVQAMLQLGHQSFSHALNTIEQHLALLQSRCDATPESRRTTVRAVIKFWSGRPLIASTLLQKFLNYRITSPVAIMQHLLIDAAVTESMTWELLWATIDKVNTRVVQVKDRLDKLTATRKEAVDLPAAEDTKMDDDGNAVVAVAGTDDELSKLERTWLDVQQEQRDVFRFAIDQLTKRSDDAAETTDKWQSYWTTGLFKSVLRRYRHTIKSLDVVAEENTFARRYL